MCEYMNQRQPFLTLTSCIRSSWVLEPEPAVELTLTITARTLDRHNVARGIEAGAPLHGAGLLAEAGNGASV